MTDTPELKWFARTDVHKDGSPRVCCICGKRVYIGDPIKPFSDGTWGWGHAECIEIRYTASDTEKVYDDCAAERESAYTAEEIERYRRALERQKDRRPAPLRPQAVHFTSEGGHAYTPDTATISTRDGKTFMTWQIPGRPNARRTQIA